MNNERESGWEDDMQIGVGRNSETLDQFMWGLLSLLGVLAASGILTLVYLCKP